MPTRDEHRAERRRRVVHHIGIEVAASRTAANPWPHLERAHILSQPWAWPHTRVHALMFRQAIRDRDLGEVTGQIVRIIVGGPGSLLGKYPMGNTGRTTMQLTAMAPVPQDLDEILNDKDR